MDKLISQQAAIDVIFNEPLYESGMKRRYADVVIPAIYEKIKSLPSAQPEIIRCKDCKHYDGRPCGIVDWYNTADDFCSRAERRTDA